MLESGLLSDTGDRFELAGPLPPFAIPSSLHDSLLARLDRLAPVKEVAQIGAVIGREFSHELLAAVADRPEAELQAAIDQLVASELIFRRGRPPEATYSFKHALVQDAAYGTLLKSRRQQLHACIGQVLERHFPEQAEAQPELIAYHCTQAGLIEKSMVYWHKAGRQAMARSALAEAVAQLTQALDLLTGLPVGPDRDNKELDLQIALGAALISTKGWAASEVGTAYARARELCTSDSQFPQLLAALSGLFAHHLQRSSKHVAHEIAGELLRFAEQRQDRSAQAAGHRFLAVTLLFNGQLLPALTHFERALALYNPAYRTSPVYLWGPDHRITGVLFTTLIMLLQGYPDQALVRSQEALAAAYELSHAYTTSQALYLTGWLHQIRGEQRLVRERAATLMGLTNERGFSAWSANAMVLHGWAVAAGGATDTGVAQLRQGLAAREAMGVQQHAPGSLGLLAGLYIGINDADEALKLLDEALARVDRLEERWFEAELHRLKGEALLRADAEFRGQAEASFRRAISVARDQSAKWWELRAAISLARLWAEQGERQKAHDLLAPIYGWFTEGFDTQDLKGAKELLEKLQ